MIPWKLPKSLSTSPADVHQRRRATPSSTMALEEVNIFVDLPRKSMLWHLDDGLLWHFDLKPHASGDFSIVVVHANSSQEDRGQVLTSPSATYVGVYDGYGGPEASRFVNSHLFSYLHTFDVRWKAAIRSCFCCSFLKSRIKSKPGLGWYKLNVDMVGHACDIEATFIAYKADDAVVKIWLAQREME
ncbi:putative protein phosphatase 2C 78 [Iris pallida]|uniref:protein-serine/threonine phosphatase n=1 Tax=Iris pallida TaxID=29817 RepID=A0AAX6DIT8_IRIPA|nr:putative protein phosphatase 2C 78 [Iris pallida]